MTAGLYAMNDREKQYGRATRKRWNNLTHFGLCLTLYLCLALQSGAQVQHPELFDKRQVRTSLRENDIQELIRNGKILFKSNRADSAIKTTLLALEQSRAIDYAPGRDSALTYFIRYLRQWKGSLTTGQAELIQKAIDYSHTTDKDIRMSWLHNNLGSYFSTTGQYAEGLQEFDHALKMLPDDTSRKTMEMKMAIYAQISEIWAGLGEEKEALKSLAIAEQIAVSRKDYHRQVSHLKIKGVMYFNNKNLDSALYFLNAALKMSEQHKDAHPPNCICRRFIVANLALVLLQMHEPQTALQYIEEQIDTLEREKAETAEKGYAADKTGDLDAFFQYLKGYAYYELRDYTKSRNILLPLLSLVQKEGVNQVEANIHEILAAQYDSTGQYEKAYRHKTAYTNLVTDHETQKEKSKLLALSYSMEKMEALAQKQVLISRQRAEIREKNVWIGTASFGSILLAATLFAFYRNNKSKQRLQHSSIINLKQEQEITKLQAKVEGEEKERSRIAHELHDGIVSQLLSLKLSMNALQMRSRTAIQPHELNDIAIQLDEATQDLRRTAHNLMPDLLLQQGLALSAAALCEKINRNTGIEADFQAYGNLPRLPQDTELALYRMVQELVQNVLKHAEATQLLVQLSCSDSLLTITVEDNGKGIPMSSLITIEKSTGLANIRKRADLMGGQLDIQSKPGERTTVYLEFELNGLLA